MSQFVEMDDDQGKFATIMSHELATLIQQNIAYLAASIPIGHIAPIMVNIPGVPTPDPNVWQLCDGSEITNPFSPLASVGINQRYTPDLRNKYPRCALLETTNPTGGTQTYDAEHDHGGVTGDTTPTPNVYWEGGLFGPHDRRKGDLHNHDLGNALADDIVVDYPAHLKVNAYMKIV